MEKFSDLTAEEKKKLRYFHVQEHFKELRSRVEADEVQEACMRDLADYRKIGLSTLQDAVGFYAEDNDELRHLAREDDDFLFHLGFKFSKGGMDYSNRYMFPVMNANQDLLAWNGYDYESGSKYVIGMLGFGEKKRLLYNMNWLSESVKEDTVIVVEGLFDSLRLNDIGMKYNVGLLGKKMSDYQKKYINRFKYAILIPDGDSAGLDMVDQWTKGLKGHVGTVKLNSRMRTLMYRDEEVEKEAKDIDDLLRENEERITEFKEMIGSMREGLRSRRRISEVF